MNNKQIITKLENINDLGDLTKFVQELKKLEVGKLLKNSNKALFQFFKYIEKKKIL